MKEPLQTGLNALVVIVCLLIVGCKPSSTQHRTVLAHTIAASDGRSGASVKLGQLDLDADGGELSRRLQILVLSEHERDTLHCLIVRNVSTLLEACSVQVCEFEPDGVRVVVVSLADATSTYGATRGYCFIETGAVMEGVRSAASGIRSHGL